MGFFSDMNEDFTDDMEEVKPITPAKEIKEGEELDISKEIDEHDLEGVEASESIDADDMFDIEGEQLEPVPIPEPKEPEKEVEEESVVAKVSPSKKVVEPASIKKKEETKEEPVAVLHPTKSNYQGGTIISEDAVLDGNLTLNGPVTVRGEITGFLKAGDVNVEGEGSVLGGIEGGKVSIEGKVSGEINAKSIIIGNSKIKGDLCGEKQVNIGPHAIIVGNVKAGELIILGKVKGDIESSTSVAVRKGAVVKGNITAPEVLIDKETTFQGSILKAVDIDDSIFE